MEDKFSRKSRVDVEFDFNKLRLDETNTNNNKNEYDNYDLLIKRSLRRESAAIFNTFTDEIPDTLNFLNDTLDINDAVDNEEYENEIRRDDVEPLNVVVSPLNTEIRNSPAMMINHAQKKFPSLYSVEFSLKNPTDKFTNTVTNITNNKPKLSSSLSLSTTPTEPPKFTTPSDENKPPHLKTENSSILQLEEQAKEALKQWKEIVVFDQDTPPVCLTPTSNKSFRDQYFEMPDFKSPDQVVRSIHRLLLGPLEVDDNNKDVSIQKYNGDSENQILSSVPRSTNNSTRNSQYSSTKSFLSREIKKNNKIDLEAEKFFLSRTTTNTNNNVNNNSNTNGLSTFSSPYSKRTFDNNKINNLQQNQAARDGQNKSMLMPRGMIAKLSTPKSVVSSAEKKQIPKPRTTSTFASRLAAKRNDRLNMGLKLLGTTGQDRNTMK
ncbi:389_t:CDS:2 [Ambispora gerdemannii]|uniref:389_t:CDS:1 n=1 Tax=Ambispora gerdemannii TaxID=144530 RepID=A0A9N8YS26_9GLOM|nr:389_t:CDS:2 [Ambispora gerdemannii]